MKLINILKEIKINNVNNPKLVFPKNKKWYTTINKDNYKHIFDILANDKFAFVPDDLRSKMGDQSFELEDEWLLVYNLKSVGIEYIYDEEEFEDDYEKIVPQLKEIKIRNINNLQINSNKDLCNFLNQNIKDLIKQENITDNDEDEEEGYIVNDISSLKLELSGGDGNEIIWDGVEIGVSYHWFCPEEDLPDGGSFEWEEDELNGVEFWTIRYNI